MSLYVGTSGYSYPEWKGLFYPQDLPEKRMLGYYGTQFMSVEINSTFHRMPSVAQLEAWGRAVPADFRFVLKAPQRITHLQRLRDADRAVSYLFEVAAALGERLGAVLFQVPPGLGRDLPLLRDFLALLPEGRRSAFQFRHRSWLDDEVLALLRRNDAAWCIADEEDGPGMPVVATARWGYLRLRRPEYGMPELARWLGVVRGQGWQDAFVFFKHEESARGAMLARRFLALAEETVGVEAAHVSGGGHEKKSEK